MRTSIMPASAKNTVVRRRVAAVAATVLLAGSVQLLTAESSWACDGAGSVSAAGGAAAAGAAEHHGDISVAFTNPQEDGQSATAGKPVEVTIAVNNSTGAPYRDVHPVLYVDSKSGNRLSEYTVEAATPNGWKKLALKQPCGPAMVADTSSLTIQDFADGRTASFRFRVTLLDKAARVKSFGVGTAVEVGSVQHGRGAGRTFLVDLPETSKPAPTTTAKPADPKASPAPKPAPAKETAKETAKPAADAAPAKETAKPAPAAPVAPKSTPSAAPATTAPAGTPELAQTGADTPNGLLAGIAAGVAALGAGMVLTVRRLRARR
ncbi:hypothetical protein ACW14Y_21655 [Kitasatospora sp. cg17-2]